VDTYLTGSTIWPDGWTKVQIYFTPRVAEIKPLTDNYRKVLGQFDFVVSVRDEWLHGIVAGVEDRPAHSVTSAEISLLESRLREQVGDLPVFTVTAGGALASRHGVVLDLTPDGEYVELRRRARCAVAEMFGAEADRYEGGRPHIPLAYGTGPGDSGLLQGRLRNATDLRVPLTVDGVRIVEVTQDPKRHEFRWREMAFVPLRSTVG
jgi:hypothetical protein